MPARVRKRRPNVKVIGVGNARIVTYGPPCARDPRWSTLLLGEAPNRWQGEDLLKRGHHTLFREDLAEYCNLTKVEYYRAFVRANLLDYWPGRSGKGSAFPMGEARSKANLVRPYLYSFTRIVLLGRRVATAFRLEKLDWYQWWPAGDSQVAVAPHPSKVSRYWNDPENVAAAKEFWSGMAREITDQIADERRRRMEQV